MSTGQFDPPTRQLAVRVRRKAVAAELERIESDLQVQRTKLRDRELTPRWMYRDINSVITTICHVRQKLNSH